MEKGRQGQEGMLDTPRKAKKARKRCKTHGERQTRHVRVVRHTLKGTQGQDGMLDTQGKAYKAREEC